MADDVQLFVELLNTRDLRTYGDAATVLERDRLTDPDALRRWLIGHGLIDAESVVDEAAHQFAVRVREGLRAVLDRDRVSRPASSDGPTLGFAIRLGAGTRPVLEPVGDDVAVALGRIVAAVAASEGAWDRLKTCAADDCRRVFYDRSKNRSARWCSSEVCGNRVRTRSYRRRSQGHDSGSPPTSTGRSPHVPRTATRRSTVRDNVLRREGDVWRIAYGDDAFWLRDSKGLAHLARLLSDPGREWHVLDLVAATSAVESRTSSGHVPGELSRMSRGGDAGPLIDAAAKDAYRRRVDDLREMVDEGRAWADPERVASAREELDAIAVELSRSLGLGGRDRMAGSDVERARVNVTRTIKATLLRIADQSPALGHHLASTVRTGTFCSYAPDPRLPVTWRI